MRLISLAFLAMGLASPSQAQEFAERVSVSVGDGNVTSCHSISAKRGWQRIELHDTDKEFVVVGKWALDDGRDYSGPSFTWSIDARTYKRVGKEGYLLDTLQTNLARFKVLQSAPIGALLFRSNAKPDKTYTLDNDYTHYEVFPNDQWYEFRINDMALGDNAGALQVCFYDSLFNSPDDY